MRRLLVVHGNNIGSNTVDSLLSMDEFTLSINKVSSMLRGIEMTETSVTTVRQDDDEVKSLFLNILERRMESGVFTIIHNGDEDFEIYKDFESLSAKYNYEIFWIDASEDIRIELPYVKVSSIEDAYSKDSLENLDKYNGIVVVGDIHSCGYTLKSILAKYSDNYKLVFLGDYFDRGDKPYETFMLLDYLTQQDYVTALLGNHDRMLLDYINDKRLSKMDTIITCSEFSNRNITRGMLRSLYNRLKDYYLFEFDGEKYLCSHAGLPWYPPNPVLVSTEQYINSVYVVAGDIDSVYKKNYKAGNPTQIHGHIMTEPNEYSFSLDGNVENGGSLRYAIIDKSGLRIEEVDNKRMEE